MARRVTLTTGEVAVRCDVAHQTAYNWIRSGKLRAHATPGGHYRVSRVDLEHFLERYGMGPGARTPSARAVLMVDDDPEVLQTMAQILERVGGYRVTCASDGFGAGLEVLRARPDLVILDLFMPQLDGFAVCRKLKDTAETRGIRILATSASPTDENVRGARDAGADAFVAKPFRMKELIEAIQGLLEVERPTALGALQA